GPQQIVSKVAHHHGHPPLGARHHPGEAIMGMDQVKRAVGEAFAQLNYALWINQLPRASSQHQYVYFDPDPFQRLSLRPDVDPERRSLSRRVYRCHHQYLHPTNLLASLEL